LVTSKATAKLGVSVEASGRARDGVCSGSMAWWWGETRAALDRGQSADSFFRAVGTWRGGGRRPGASLVRGGPGDNVSAILGDCTVPRLDQPPPGQRVVAAFAGRAWRQPSAHRQPQGPFRHGGVVDASWETGLRFRVDARQVSGRFGSYGTESNPAFGAESLTLQGSLAGLRPVGWPEASVREGYLRPLATLPLTGISGAVRPAAAASGSSAALLICSFPAATAGQARPVDGDRPTATVDRFSLAGRHAFASGRALLARQDRRDPACLCSRT